MNNSAGRWLFFIVFTLTFAGHADADDASGKALQQRLRQVSLSLGANKSGKINFVEERHSKILATPAVFRGYLIFDADSGNMSKVITEPESIAMTIEAKHIVIDKNGKTRRMSLRLRPGLRAFVSLFASLRTGDIVTLRQNFLLDYDEDKSTWRLTLTPQRKKLAQRLKAVLIEGNTNLVEVITTTMQNNDRQIMRFVPSGVE